MLKAGVITVTAWFIGVVLDANTGSGEFLGFLGFGSLFAVLAMGSCILYEFKKLTNIVKNKITKEED